MKLFSQKIISRSCTHNLTENFYTIKIFFLFLLAKIETKSRFLPEITYSRYQERKLSLLILQSHILAF